mgnify:FL=1
MPIDLTKNDTVAWYVMRVTYQRELSAMETLTKENIRSYVPTTRVRKRNAFGMAIGWKTEALVHNYIFIYSTLPIIQQIKTHKIQHLRYLMAKDSSGEIKPQIVPDKQMQDFIKVTESRGSKQLDPAIDLRKGDRVRILTGPFEGVEGIFIQMPNRHEKRVVVKIEGIAAVATTVLKSTDVIKL